MKIKVLEIRDRSTYFAVLAVDMNPDNTVQRHYMRQVGYPCDGAPNIAITHLTANGGPFWNDPYAWGGRTYGAAHKWIIENWDNLNDGDVVDVEFILQETDKPKMPERYEDHMALSAAMNEAG